MSKGMQVQASEFQIFFFVCLFSLGFFGPQFGSIFLQNYVHLK